MLAEHFAVGVEPLFNFLEQFLAVRPGESGFVPAGRINPGHLVCFIPRHIETMGNGIGQMHHRGEGAAEQTAGVVVPADGHAEGIRKSPGFGQLPPDG